MEVFRGNRRAFGEMMIVHAVLKKGEKILWNEKGEMDLRDVIRKFDEVIVKEAKK